MRIADVDAVVVGSGCGGLIAATKLREAGLDPLLIEKTEYVGGTAAWALGGLWFPANPLEPEAGIADSVEDGLAYVEAAVGDQGPATTRARQEAYMRGGQRLIGTLLDWGVPLRIVPDYPDYYPELPGSRLSGRILHPPMVDARRLGPWQDLVRPRPPVPFGLVVDSVPQFRALLAAGYSWPARREVARVAQNSLRLRLQGVKPLVFGQAYIGWLMLAAQQAGVRLRTQTPLEQLIIESGQVRGVIAGGEQIAARHGVLLNAGGFARNLDLRNRYGPHPASTSWTAVTPGDTGDVLIMTRNLDVATTGLDRAYWMPGIVGPDGQAVLCVAERHLPHSILVDASAARFTNEATSYTQLGNNIYRRHHDVPAIPSWLVIDSQHRRKYLLGETPPRASVRRWVRSGHLKCAGTLRELAGKCGLDADALERTVQRFNRMAEAGVDEDFRRGDSPYDRVYADPTHGPNPSLGTIAEPPFYAAKLVPTDIGMAGGLLTDEYARVLDSSGSPVEGLYASGTTAASAFGDVYVGGGISLGQASVFGMIGAEHIAARARAAAPVGIRM